MIPQFLRQLPESHCDCALSLSGFQHPDTNHIEEESIRGSWSANETATDSLSIDTAIDDTATAHQATVDVGESGSDGQISGGHAEYAKCSPIGSRCRGTS